MDSLRFFLLLLLQTLKNSSCKEDFLNTLATFSIKHTPKKKGHAVLTRGIAALPPILLSRLRSQPQPYSRTMAPCATCNDVPFVRRCCATCGGRKGRWGDAPCPCNSHPECRHCGASGIIRAWFAGDDCLGRGSKVSFCLACRLRPEQGLKLAVTRRGSGERKGAVM